MLSALKISDAMNPTPNQEKREKWRALIDEQEKGELFQEEFCKQNNISSSSFTYYRGKFRGKQTTKKLTGIFAPVSVSKITSLNEIRLTLPNGFPCSFPSDLELSQVNELIGIFLSN